MGAIRTRQVMLSLRRRRVQWPAAVAVSALMGALVIAPEAATASTATGPSCTDTGGYRTCVYGFTGNVDSWTVPAGLTSPTVTVDLRGASGGDGRTAKGGNGAFVEVKMNLAAGDTLSFLAGSQGASFTPTQYLGSFAGVSGFRSGGFPDGGDAGLRSTNDTSAGGGGGSTLLVVKRAGTSVNDFVADAAGGGGAGGDGGAGYWMTKVGAVPTGGAGGAGDAAGTAGGSSTDPSYAAATGGNPGSQGTLDAVGIGGAGVSGCVAGGGLSNPGANGVTLDLTVPTYGDGGHGGLGYTGDPRPVGDGGGGGGGYRGGGGGSAGGTCYLPVGSTSPYDYTAAGGGGAGGASAVDSAEVVSQFSATRDKHGDGSVSITFAVGDITPPTTTIDSAPTDPTDKTDATLFFHGADTGGSGIDHFECSLDTAAFVTCTSPVTYTGLATGAHQVRVRAVDGNGNTDPTPATASWTFVDTTPPHTSLDSVPPATIYVPSATVHFSGTDNSDPDGIARFECSLDGADFSTCTSPATFDGLSIGDHTIEVRAVDRGGNIDPTPATTSFTVSAATPPSACTVSGTSTTCTYSALDLPYWTFTVPAKVVSLHVVADGARGGNNGGNGGRAVATVAVTPGEVLRVYLGGHGQSGNSDCRTGGANGGGAGACLPSPPGPSISGGGGGGASDVRRAPYGLGDRLVVGAGGGGGDVYLTQPGGAGGGVEGAPGSGTLPGSGGTQTAGGAVGTQSCSGSDSAGSSGEFGLGGNGAYCPDPSGFGSIGGGGGGGWYGGGGAGSDPHGESSGGGGGSSYAVPSATGVTLITGGGSTYDGRVQLTYTLDTVAPS
ncbi:MAG: glycine-rich protein, partial [Motilibacteraceae bacterium]